MLTYWGLLAFFVLEYVRVSAYVPALAILNSAVPLTVAAAAIAGRSKVSNAEVWAEPASKGLAVLFGLLLLSVLTARVTERAFDIWLGVTGYILMYWTIVKLGSTKARIKGIFRTLVVVHVAIAALNPQLMNATTREYVQAGAFLSDGNDLSLSLNIAIPLCLYLLLDARRVWERLFSLAALAVFVMCIVATQSRGGTVALACLGAYYWAKSRSKAWTSLAVVAALIGIVAFAPPAYFARMNDVTNTQEGSAQGRIEAWTGAVEMAVDNPLLGVGAGHFAVIYGAVYGAGNKTAHSIYFLILGELGLPGFIFLLWFLWTSLKAGSAAAKAAEARDTPEGRASAQLMTSVNAALFAYATGGAFLSAVYYPHLYVVSGLLVAARRLATAEGAAASEQIRLKPSLELHWSLRPRLPRVS